ncbi:membrane protein insertase YidC [Candidatus Berkiella aquae]|uniref:Membrane protein insertase YidC n=1 Tax=Candidatus Berkiella aquae TaxID=295108 RepID=A0A0Q9YYG0_9GAMM|nr:membrane protein insertase YidC [Candidatus Berkiella aquae]MCS5712760.1 membrane protein insertase YidC [Candidatus Berkiella aquae]
MELQRTRMFLLIALLVVGFALFSEWQKEHPALPKQTHSQSASSATKEDSEIPAISTNQSTAVMPVSTPSSASADLIDVTTDVLKIKIDPIGGDIVRAELLKYPEKLHSEQGVLLLDKTALRNYVAQTGLVGKNELGPDSRQQGRARYTVTQNNFQLNQDVLNVDLHWQHESGIKVTKTFVFKRGNYLVDVNYQIQNDTDNVWLGNIYGQLRREYVKGKSNGMLGVQNYEGAALSTPEKPYKKLSFPDMKKAPLRQTMEGGWAAMVEHYFLSAWIPAKESANVYYSRVDDDNVYNIGALTAVEVAPHKSETVGGQLYLGPEVAEKLKAISPGLELTIDYGILWPISQLLFWALQFIHGFVSNWGFAIILLTLVVKLLFYSLSASSYRSMGHMRRLQPRVEMLKERHGNDKQQFSAALMELYRKEKVNPLGGCLPILIQIPVFIALYYVLLESIELRQAPFILWIQDLSSKDPYYVLPLIMGATMFLQQKMNPAPPDPMQAKMMMFMPVIFTVLFLSFPAGLVLYWTVNNILSISQQWFITRNIEREATLKKVK